MNFGRLPIRRRRKKRKNPWLLLWNLLSRSRNLKRLHPFPEDSRLPISKQ